jgi:type I restriction-modification system DNA methylase subunit
MNNINILQETSFNPQTCVAGFFHERRRGIGTPVPLFPSPMSFEEKFGFGSKIYNEVRWRTEMLFKKVESKPEVKSLFDSWYRRIKNVYGYAPEKVLFFDHTYLNIMAKVGVYLKFRRKPDMVELLKVISGDYFARREFTNLLEDDFSLWLSCSEIKEHAFSLYYLVLHRMKDYDFSLIKEDVFSIVYENIIGQGRRFKPGEYLTPSWSASLIISEAMSLWNYSEPDKIPRIADLSCGTGTFIFQAVKHLARAGKSFDEIKTRVSGIDKNPMASFIGRVNYILAADKIGETSECIEIPVRFGDPLKANSNNSNQDGRIKFDIIIGNPPWMVMSSLKDRKYQSFLKEQVLSYGLLTCKDIHLFSQMELAALFFCKCADLYLEDKGIIAFIMPRSVLEADRHQHFRKFENPSIKLLKIIDLEGIRHLFNIPACVLIGVKDGSTVYPVVSDKYSGMLMETLTSRMQPTQSFSKEVALYSPPNFQHKLSPL